jgi:molybdenum cofactor biosynthesis protein MoaC
MAKFTHIDHEGKAKMVDVSDKKLTKRIAESHCKVILSKEALEAIIQNKIQKGDVLAVARVAGIMAAKKTSELIPLCHNISVDSIDIDFVIDENKLEIEVLSKAITTGKTGIEMESLTAVAIAALTIYDMCKSIDKSIIITDVELLHKSGGKSGIYRKN